uniref:Uncharacterized protein n=1 Tax=Glossina brevipalpis TaxID=37001 RepID=A0A1A9W9G2_9MUSC
MPQAVIMRAKVRTSHAKTSSQLRANVLCPFAKSQREKYNRACRLLVLKLRKEKKNLCRRYLEIINTCDMSLESQTPEIEDYNSEDELSQNETIDSGCVSDSSDSSLDIVSKSTNKESNDKENKEENLNIDRKYAAKVMNDSGFLSDSPSVEKESNDEQSEKNDENNTLNNFAGLASKVLSEAESSKSWNEIYQQNDDDGNTELHLACISEDINVIQSLLFVAPHPCLYNTLNYDCRTPLHLAALAKRPQVLRKLLLAGANPTICDRQGNTALHLACRSGFKESVLALIAPLNEDELVQASHPYAHHIVHVSLTESLQIRNYNGEGCIHVAAELGSIDILRPLILHGADINSREYKFGRTPLHIAIASGNEVLVNFLLNECKKINLEMTTYSGLTPYQLASRCNRLELQNKLIKHGAEILSASESEDNNSETDTDSESDDSIDNVSDSFGFLIFTDGHIEMADGSIVGPL